jgi:hypothetical protein
MEEKDLAAFAMVFAVAGSLWAFWFGVVYGQQNALWTDEGDYVLIARNIMSAGKFRTADDPLGILGASARSPAIPYATASVAYVLGDDILSGHAAVALFMALGVLATFILSRKLFGDIAAIVAVMLLVTSQMFWFYGARILTDGPQMFFAAMGALSFFEFVRGGKWKWLALGAFFVAFGGLARYTFLALGVGLLGGAAVYRREMAERLQRIDLGGVGVAALAVAAMAVPFAAYQIENTGSPIGFASEYFSGTNAWADVGRWFYFENSQHIFNNSFTVLFIASGILVSFFKRNREGMALSLALLLPLLFMTLIMNWKEDRYAIYLLPMAFALAGYAASKLARPVIAALDGKGAMGVSTAFCALMLVFLAASAYANVGTGTERYETAWGLYLLKRDSYSQAREAGLFVRNITAEGERVLAQGYTQIGAYSGRVTTPLPHGYDEFERVSGAYGAKVFVVSALEFPAEFEKAVRAVQNGTRLDGSTLYRLFVDAAHYKLENAFTLEVPTEDGKTAKQPVVFVIRKVS